LSMILRWGVLVVMICCGEAIAEDLRQVSTKNPVVREGKVEIGVRVGESMRLSGRLGADEYRLSDKIAVDSYSAGRAAETREGLAVKEEVETRKVAELPAVVGQRQSDEAARLKQVKFRRANAF